MKYLIAAVVFVMGMVLQWWWSSHLAIWGLAPQALLVLTVAIAAHEGPIAGQCFGFAWGLFLDVLGVHLFGANALVLTGVAYGVGVARRQMDVSSPVSQLMMTALVTVCYFASMALVGFVFQRQGYFAGWAVVVFSPVYNALVAPFLFAFVDRVVEF